MDTSSRGCGDDAVSLLHVSDGKLNRSSQDIGVVPKLQWSAAASAAGGGRLARPARAPESVRPSSSRHSYTRGTRIAGSEASRGVRTRHLIQ